MVDGVAESFRPLVERKGLALRVACDADLPTLMTDGEKVERILRNLLANALKFTDHGSIRLEARLGDAELLAGFNFIHDMADGGRPPDGHTVVVLVQDTGIGIRGADVAALAADFKQVDTEAAARFGGTGLGLSISRKLVELLGGRLGVRSRYGEGSEFVVCLPLPVNPVARAVPAVVAPLRVPSAA